MATIEELRGNIPFWYKLNVFIYDLQKFGSDKASEDRLNSVTDNLYLSAPYFEIEEVEMLRCFKSTSNGKTLESLLREKLNNNIKQKKRVCTSHHVLPVFEQAFGLSARKLSEDKVFKKLVKKGGLQALDDGGSWNG